MRVLIICDSFGIGGIERLALDQSYQLNKQGMFSEILILSDIPSDEKATFPNNEKELIEQLSIKIRYLPGSRLKQFIELFKIVDKGNYNYIFAYSLKGTVLAKLCRFRIRENSIVYIDFKYEDQADYFVKALNKTKFEYTIILVSRIVIKLKQFFV